MLAGDPVAVGGKGGDVPIENLGRDFLKHSDYSYKFSNVNVFLFAHADILYLNKNLGKNFPILGKFLY